MMEQGPSEKRVMEQCIRANREFPEKIKNAPSLLMGLELFFRCWMELGTCRLSVMEEAPIPYTAISQYARDYGIVGELYEDLVYFVRFLDTKYLEYQKDKKPKITTGEKGGKKGPRKL